MPISENKFELHNISCTMFAILPYIFLGCFPQEGKITIIANSINIVLEFHH